MKSADIHDQQSSCSNGQTGCSREPGYARSKALSARFKKITFNDDDAQQLAIFK